MKLPISHSNIQHIEGVLYFPLKVLIICSVITPTVILVGFKKVMQNFKKKFVGFIFQNTYTSTSCTFLLVNASVGAIFDNVMCYCVFFQFYSIMLGGEWTSAGFLVWLIWHIQLSLSSSMSQIDDKKPYKV